MNQIENFLKTLVLVIFVVVVPQYAAAQTAAPVCTNLTSDVSSGMTDTTANGEIMQLQNFLAVSGYFSATPNGHFGPATLAAVESFQSAHGISATGYVGPLTRAFIENKTCIVSSTATNIQASPTSTPAPQTLAITSPAAHQSLTLGSNYTVRWNGATGYNYSIVLEDQNGVGEGIIASSLSGGNGQYVWQVGKIISPDGTGYETIIPGTYRIHIETSGQDMYSGLFTTVSPPIGINSIIPSTAPDDGTTAIVLFGSGFVNSPTVYIDGYYGATTLFISPDGKVIVFSIPKTIAAGTHSLEVTNQYGSGSNGMVITVTTPPSTQ